MYTPSGREKRGRLCFCIVQSTIHRGKGKRGRVPFYRTTDVQYIGKRGRLLLYKVQCTGGKGKRGRRDQDQGRPSATSQLLLCPTNWSTSHILFIVIIIIVPIVIKVNIIIFPIIIKVTIIKIIIILVEITQSAIKGIRYWPSD